MSREPAVVNLFQRRSLVAYGGPTARMLVADLLVEGPPQVLLVEPPELA